MNIERSGRIDPHGTIRHMRWAENPGDERRDGIRIGYARGFVWIPEEEAVTVATQLVDYIAANGINANTHA